MRSGLLGRPDAAAVAASQASVAAAAQTTHQAGTPAAASMTPQQQQGGNNSTDSFMQGYPSGSPTKMMGFAWKEGEVVMTMKDGSHVAIDPSKEDVEVMSTDSSSSSSTDSN